MVSGVGCQVSEKSRFQVSGVSVQHLTPLSFSSIKTDT